MAVSELCEVTSQLENSLFEITFFLDFDQIVQDSAQPIECQDIDTLTRSSNRVSLSKKKQLKNALTNKTCV